MPRTDLRTTPFRCIPRGLRGNTQDLLRVHAHHLEPLSLDEAYLDVTETLPQISSATQIAREIRTKIRERTHLTASAGISYNKLLAKLASDHRKPDGWLVITPAMGLGFVETLPVKKFHGIGPATAARMSALGIETGLDLRAGTLSFLRQHFGKAGTFYYWIARGIDDRPVRADRKRKSIGATTTFLHDIFIFDAAQNALQPLIAKAWRLAENTGSHARTVTLKVKYSNFQTLTRSHTDPLYIGDRKAVKQIAGSLLERLFPVPKGIRLLGITLSSFQQPHSTVARQLALALDI